MPAMQQGRICIKLAGRDAGEKVVITKVVDKNTVMVKSPVRKAQRKCSIRHLEPTDVVVSS